MKQDERGYGTFLNRDECRDVKKYSVDGFANIGRVLIDSVMIIAVMLLLLTVTNFMNSNCCPNKFL